MSEAAKENQEQFGANYDPLADAVARSAEQYVELPGWGDGKPWRAKLRRVSLMNLAMQGAIPNPLMAAVQSLYTTGTTGADLKTSAETMRLMADAVLVEPTLTQLDEAGVVLTDMQLTALYLYGQRGPEALAPFRSATAVSNRVPHGKTLRDEAK